MKTKWLIVALGVIFFSGRMIGQQNSFKGLYVDKFDNILGNLQKEDSLLNYASFNGINYLAFYNLARIDFSNSAKMAQLRSFLNRARTTFNITSFGATGETIAFFTDNIIPFNNSSTGNEKFNVFNLEFEFWLPGSVGPGGVYANYLTSNGFSTDTSGAFKYYRKMLGQLKSLAQAQGAMTETYVGWFNQNQGKVIGELVDRVLLHAYRQDAASTFNYSQQRLSYLATSTKKVTVAPIFSSENDFMGPWLQSNDAALAYSTYLNNYNASAASWKQNINMVGYQWFKYTLMPYNVPGVPTSTAAQDDLEIIEQSTKVYPNPAKSELTLEVNPRKTKKVDVMLINVAGQLVEQKTFFTENEGQKIKETIDLTGLAAGVYLLQLLADEKKVGTRKIMIE